MLLCNHLLDISQLTSNTYYKIINEIYEYQFQLGFILCNANEKENGTQKMMTSLLHINLHIKPITIYSTHINQ